VQWKQTIERAKKGNQKEKVERRIKRYGERKNENPNEL
jgi:hypothetical protein